MSINVILCHPAADSLVELAAADAYALNHPAGATWASLTEARREQLLIAASRHVSACPLIAPPLLTRLNTELEQALPIPVMHHKHKFSTADDGTTTTLVDAALQSYPDDLFAGGSVFFLSGTGAGQWASAVSFAVATGTLTLSPELSTAPDATTHYLLVWPLSHFTQGAVIEQALHLAGGVNLDLLDDAGMGVTSFSPGDGGSMTLSKSGSTGHLCHEARLLLKRSGLLSAARSLEVGRG